MSHHEIGLRLRQTGEYCTGVFRPHYCQTIGTVDHRLGRLHEPEALLRHHTSKYLKHEEDTQDYR